MSVDNLLSNKVIPDADSRIRRARKHTHLKSRSLDEANIIRLNKEAELESCDESPRNRRRCSSPIEDKDDFDMAQDFDTLVSLGSGLSSFGLSEILSHPSSRYLQEFTTADLRCAINDLRGLEDVLGRPNQPFMYDARNEIIIHPKRRSGRRMISNVETLKDPFEKLLDNLDGGCEAREGYIMPGKGSIDVRDLKMLSGDAGSDDDSATPTNGSIASGEHVALNGDREFSNGHGRPFDGSIVTDEDFAPFGEHDRSRSNLNALEVVQDESRCSEDATAEKGSFYSCKISSPCFYPSSFSFSSVSSFSYNEDSSGWSTISSSPLLASSPNPTPGFSHFKSQVRLPNPSYVLASQVGPIPNCPLFSRRENCRSDCPFVHNGVETEIVARKLEFGESFLEEKLSDDIKKPFEMNIKEFDIPKLLTASEYFHSLLTPISTEEMMIRKKGPYTSYDLLDCDTCYPDGPCLFEAMEKKYQRELITDQLMKIIFS